MKNCPNCNNQNEDNAAFCDNCGAPLSNVPSAGPGMAAGGGQQQYVPQVQGQPAPGMVTPAGGNIVCPNCGTQNMAGTMFCDNCGNALAGVAPQGGAQGGMPGGMQGGMPGGMQGGMPGGMQGGMPGSIPGMQGGMPGGMQGGMPGSIPGMQGGMPMPGGLTAAPRLMINNQPVTNVPLKNELIIGRSDLASGWNPDIDLAPFGGTPDAGVSRRHARLVWRNTWMIEDMGSVNGTFLNQQRLAPNQPMPLNPGATIQLGKLYVVFQG
ncbi:MAG: FHA domain-containing protein [Anaerolineae bacterium]